MFCQNRGRATSSLPLFKSVPFFNDPHSDVNVSEAGGSSRDESAAAVKEN